MSDDRLEQAQHDARHEAVPFVLAAAVADVALAATSAWHGWRLFSEQDWWVWFVLATPAVVLAVVFALGFGRLGVRSEHRRRLALGLLGLLVAANLLGISLVLGSLLSGHKDLTGGQLLFSAGVVLVVNVITFSLVFWEVDCGGPIHRAMTRGRSAPDFQFPQDENTHLAAPAWAPRLEDYLYIALTNSIAFSPTDAMPLTHRAKLFMGIESLIAAVTVLVVAARAVNIFA
jgi:hypothetical protein